MKKLLTFFLTALLAFSVGWAETEQDVLNLSFTGVTGTSYTDFSGKTGTSGAVYAGNCAGGNSSIQLRSNNNNSGIVTTTSGGKVRKITVVWQLSTNQGRKLNVYGKNSAYSAATDLYTSGSQGTLLTSLEKTAATGTAYTTEFTVTGDYEYIGFRSNSGAQYITSITIVWETGGGSTVVAPTIDPAGGNFGGSQTVTLSHADADAIYYTLDGSDPTTSSTLYTAPFTITTTTTVKAIAVKNNESSSVASATFTEMGVGTIAAAYALAQSSQFVFTGNAVVTYQNGPNIWIRDNSGSGMIYGYNLGSYVNGDILDAGWSATNTTYNQVIPQFGSASGLSSSSNGGTVMPVDKTSTGVTNANIHEYVSFSHFTTTWDSSVGYRYITIDNHNIYLKDQFSQGFTFTNGKYYDIEGIVYIDTQNNNNTIVYLTKVTEVTTTNPQLIVSPDELTINDSGTNNTFTVEGSNLGTDNVGLTQSGSNFVPTLSATTGSTYYGDNYWGFTPADGSVNGTVAMNYTGHELSASETVTLGNNTGASATVTVNYRADVYILGNYGSGWDYSNGILMTYDATNNTYTASVTASVGNLIVFARKLGESNPWNTRILFGPNSTGDCWVSGDFTGTIDLNDDDPIYFNSAGTYVIEINATTGALTITKEVVNTGDFELVTNVNDLVAGNEIIFVSSGSAGSAEAMSTTQNNNNRGVTDVTVSATNKVTATATTQIFTLEGSSAGWYFKTVNGDNQGYIYAASNSSNHLKTEATADDNAKATISLASDGEATIVFQGDNGRNNLRYNGSNNPHIYSCYGSSSSTTKPFIYQREASVQEPSITVNPSSLELVIPVGGSSQSGSVTVTETNTTGTTSVSINGDTNIFSASLSNGTLTVTYTGTATQANPDQATITLTNGTATATVTVTGYKRVEATGTLYTKVTSADQIQDGLKYILVHEEGPDALNNFTSSATGGTGVAVTWETQSSVVNIANTDAIEFTLDGDASAARFFYNNDVYLGRSGNNGLADNSETIWTLIKDSDNGGYYLAVGTASNSYRLRYNAGMSGDDKFRCYANNTGEGVYLYVQGEAGLATPHISPESGRFTEDQEVTITCATTGATIYYTVNGGETQTYNGPFTVDVDEDHTQATIVAWAEKDDLTSGQVSVTYTYYNGHVSSIAEFLALDNGEEAIFDNPVVVLFDYSQNSGSGQEYIWIKDRTGYTQLFITPQFDNDSVADPQYNNSYGNFVPKYENGDVIRKGFKVKKNFYSTGQYVQAMCTDTHDTFQEAEEKALADPEQVKLSELLANPANYNNRYLYINKLQVSNISGFNFSVSADENGDNVSEVQGGSAIVGYNKYNSPAWKNKNGEVVGVTLPTNSNFYNVKFIFQKWDNGYEIMPIKFTPWEETSLLLEDLVQVGVEGQPYTISNQLHAVAVTWDSEKDMFAIFAKDDGMYANKRYPATGQDTYLIRYENQNGTFINEVEQEDYDQSNWIEILIPSTVTSKTTDVNAYIQELGNLQSTFENKILNAGSVIGTYVDALNPTIEVTALPTVASLSTYEPNIYCTANFLMENLDTDGAQGNDGNYFMMDAKPHEFCKVVWAYYDNSNGNYFVIPAREGNVVNGHGFTGSFMANMSLCEDYKVYYDFNQIRTWFLDSNDESYNGQQTLYGFDAIIRKNPNANNSNGAPRRIQPGTGDFEQTPAYIVYPLNAGGNSNDNVVGVKEVLGNKAIESVHYYNMMGMEGKTPFEGINIVVTRYTDGSTSTIKVMK